MDRHRRHDDDDRAWNGTPMQGPTYHPRSQPFERYSKDVYLWLCLTEGKMKPSQQCAALIRGLRGEARTLADTLPQHAITYGSRLNGVDCDPVTVLMYYLAQEFEIYDEERVFSKSMLVIDFRGKPGETWTECITRFNRARNEAAEVGSVIQDWQQLSTILFRALGIGGERLAKLLEPTNGNMPRNQLEWDNLINKIKMQSRFVFNHPANISNQIHRRGGGKGHKGKTYQTSVKQLLNMYQETLKS